MILTTFLFYFLPIPHNDNISQRGMVIHPKNKAKNILLNIKLEAVVISR
jgi:hypothetical protein